LRIRYVSQTERVGKRVAAILLRRRPPTRSSPRNARSPTDRHARAGLLGSGFGRCDESNDGGMRWGWDTAHIVGNSIGGGVALEWSAAAGPPVTASQRPAGWRPIHTGKFELVAKFLAGTCRCGC